MNIILQYVQLLLTYLLGIIIRSCFLHCNISEMNVCVNFKVKGDKQVISCTMGRNIKWGGGVYFGMYAKGTLIIYAAKRESGVGKSSKTITIQPSLQWNILRKTKIWFLCCLRSFKYITFKILKMQNDVKCKTTTATKMLCVILCSTTINAKINL